MYGYIIYCTFATSISTTTCFLQYSRNFGAASNNDSVNVFNNINHFKITIMKNFEVIGTTVKFNFHFPTSLDEIDADYLKTVTDNVLVPDHHCLVGIVYHEKLFDIIVSRKRNQKGLTAGVVPIFIKAGKTDSEFIQSAECRDKLIIPSTSLSLGHHVAAPKNVLSLDYFIRAIDSDNNLAKRYDNNYGNEQCFFVEFKIIPNVEIKGIYKEAENVDTKKYVETSMISGGDC